MGDLADAISEAGREPEELEEALGGFGRVGPQIEDRDDAETVVQLLETIGEGESGIGELRLVGRLASKFESAAEHDAVYELLAADGIDALLELGDLVYAAAAHPEARPGDLEAMLEMLVAFARYGCAEGGEYAVRMLNEGRAEDRPEWTRFFNALVGDNPVTDVVFDGVTGFPGGEVGADFLSAANDLYGRHVLEEHPFDSGPGRRELERYLEADDARSFPAAEALWFLEDVEALLDDALRHPDPNVRLEAAGAAASRGGDEALETVVDAVRDPATANHALQVLEDLEKLDQAPQEALNDDHFAAAELCDWLTHPNEYGRPPDDIELLDHREAHWPPTEDTRELRLFRFEYDGAGEHGDGEQESEVGVGMVGSVTFALASLTGLDEVPDPEEAYALHCCYELTWNDDPRAPAEASVEAGRRLLDW